MHNWMVKDGHDRVLIIPALNKRKAKRKFKRIFSNANLITAVDLGKTTTPIRIGKGMTPSRRVVRKKPGVNEPCPCGSGKKFKYCHLKKGVG